MEESARKIMTEGLVPGTIVGSKDRGFLTPMGGKVYLTPRAQRLAQEAAVSLAEGRFADTKKDLKGLHDHMNSMEEWNRFCREGLPRQPKVIP